MTLERIIKIFEQFVDVELSVDLDRTRLIADSYRTQLIAVITKLHTTDLIVLALVLVEGPSRKQ
jgi:hypothetical protein